MFGVADYGAFVAAIVLFLAIPGPGNLALITSTGQGGIRSGMAACGGVIAADQVLMWLAVAGMAALLAAHPAAFAALTFLYSLTVVLLTHFLADRLRANPRIVQALEKTAGTFIIGFGIKLAISK